MLFCTTRCLSLTALTLAPPAQGLANTSPFVPPGFVCAWDNWPHITWVLVENTHSGIYCLTDQLTAAILSISARMRSSSSPHNTGLQWKVWADWVKQCIQCDPGIIAASETFAAVPSSVRICRNPLSHNREVLRAVSFYQTPAWLNSLMQSLALRLCVSWLFSLIFCTAFQLTQLVAVFRTVHTPHSLTDPALLSFLCPSSARAEFLVKHFQQAHSGWPLLRESHQSHTQWFRVCQRTCSGLHLSSTAISKLTCGSHNSQPCVPLLCRNSLPHARTRGASPDVEVCMWTG